MNELMSVPILASQIVAAGLVLILAVWLPGKLFLRRLRLTADPVDVFVCALGCGIALLALVYWILQLAHVPFLLWGYALLCSAVEIRFMTRASTDRRQRPLLCESVNALRSNWPLALILIVSVFSQGRFLFTGGWFGPDGVVFPWVHVHDGPDHVFLIHQLSCVFPPEAIGFAGVPLTNYHFFTDLFWGAISRMGSVDPWHIYFRIAPSFCAMFITLAAYAVARLLYEDRKVAFLAAAVCVLASDFSYLVALVMPDHGFTTWDGIFMVQPPLTGMAGLTAAMAYAQTLAGLWALVHWLRKREFGALLILGLVWGTLPEFKAYPAVLVTAGLLVTGLIRLALNRDTAVLKAFLAVLPLNIILIAIFNSSAGGVLRFLPGFNLVTILVLNKMVAAGTLVQLYEQHLPLLVVSMGGMLVLFAIVTLGIRCAALPALFRAVWSPRKADPIALFLTVVTGGALVASMAFVQTGVPVNTIQFFYYAVLLLSLPAAHQVMKWTSGRAPWSRAAATSLFILLGLVGTIQAWFFSSIVTEKYALSRLECDGLLWIRSNTEPDVVLLRPLPPELLTDEGYAQWLSRAQWRNLRTLADWRKTAKEYDPTSVGSTSQDANPRSAESNPDPKRALPKTPSRIMPLKWGDTAIVSATTFRRTYVESLFTAQSQMMNDEPEQRVQKARQFYLTSSATEAAGFLRDNNIGIVIREADRPFLFHPEDVPLHPVYSNASMVVYRTEPRPVP